MGFLIFVSGTFPLANATSPALFPAYASVGAFANYTGSGGFIAFLSGVSGNLTYFVSSVYSNGTMLVNIKGNLSLGTEVGIPTSQVSENLTDSVFHPRILPAIPPQNLTAEKIIFQNITCSFVKNSAISVPAGTFNATEFQGTGANGSVLDFWFDRSSGLAVQMAGSGAEFQLLNSNIAVPIGFQSDSSIGTQIIVVFIAGWMGAGLLFYSVRRYYLKKSKFIRSPANNLPEELDGYETAGQKKKKAKLR
jgi:hypothetical protein